MIAAIRRPGITNTFASYNTMDAQIGEVHLFLTNVGAMGRGIKPHYRQPS